MSDYPRKLPCGCVRRWDWTFEERCEMHQAKVRYLQHLRKETDALRRELRVMGILPEDDDERA